MITTVDLATSEVYAEVMRSQTMIQSNYALMQWVTTAAAVVLVMQCGVIAMQVWKIFLHRKAFRLIAAQDKMVRENLQVQTTLMAAMAEYAKAWGTIGVSSEKAAVQTLKEVKQVVLDGQTAVADAAAVRQEVSRAVEESSKLDHITQIASETNDTVKVIHQDLVHADHKKGA